MVNLTLDRYSIPARCWEGDLRWNFLSSKADEPLQEGEGFAGEGRPGLFNTDEPLPVQALRARMRVLHHPISTENTYAGWIARLVRHLDDENLEKYTENALGDWPHCGSKWQRTERSGNGVAKVCR